MHLTKAERIKQEEDFNRFLDDIKLQNEGNLYSKWLKYKTLIKADEIRMKFGEFVMS